MASYAYLRTSSATNVDGDSDVRQRLAVVGYASANGRTIAGEYYDADVSGVDPVTIRPAFTAMLAVLQAGDEVVVEDASRFARHVMAQEGGIAVLIERGVSLVTANGQVLTDNNDPARVAMRQMFGVFAQYERSVLVAKLKDARDRASVVKGSRVEGKKPNAALHAECKAIAAANPTWSLRKIAGLLEERGYVSCTGKRLFPAHVNQILHYVGVGTNIA